MTRPESRYPARTPSRQRMGLTLLFRRFLLNLLAGFLDLLAHLFNSLINLFAQAFRRSFSFLQPAMPTKSKHAAMSKPIFFSSATILSLLSVLPVFNRCF